ncbi:MAG TPA: hypothetical protein VIN09_00065 [Chloroflexota bacterium]
MSKRVVGLMQDLFFASRLEEAARRLGHDVAVARSADEFRAHVSVPPDLVVVDIGEETLPWEDLVQELKGLPSTEGVPVLAFGPHRDLAARERALQAGADRVVANSQFARELPRLLEQYLSAGGL